MSLKSKVKRFQYFIFGTLKLVGFGLASPFDKTSRKNILRAMRSVHFYERATHLSRKSIDVMFSKTEPVTLSNIHSENWQVSTAELAIINTIAKAIQAKNIFEIGTFDGRTTLNLHRNCPDALIHTVDLPPEQQHLPDGKVAGQLLQQDSVNKERVKQIYCNSLKDDFGPFYGKQDFIFIDADHSYKGAKGDTLTSLKLLEGREGVIIWHDYGVWPGVTQAVEETEPLIASDVSLIWVDGTTLAVLKTADNQPLKLK